jgi:hypothetical protein
MEITVATLSSTVFPWPSVKCNLNSDSPSFFVVKFETTKDLILADRS